MILRHNARYPNDSKPLPQWITESPDNYATLIRPLPESKTDRIFIYDKVYRCDPCDELTIFDPNALSFKIQITNPQEHPETIPQFLPLLSPILKNSDPTPTLPVTITSTPIDAEDNICIGDKTIRSRQAEQQREVLFSPTTATICTHH